MGRLKETAENIKDVYRLVGKMQECIESKESANAEVEQLGHFKVLKDTDVTHTYSFLSIRVLSAKRHLIDAIGIVLDGPGSDSTEVKGYLSPTDVEKLIDELIDVHKAIKQLTRVCKAYMPDSMQYDSDKALRVVCNLMGLYPDKGYWNGLTVRQLVENNEFTCSEVAILCSVSVTGIWEQ